MGTTHGRSSYFVATENRQTSPGKGLDKLADTESEAELPVQLRSGPCSVLCPKAKTGTGKTLAFLIPACAIGC